MRLALALSLLLVFTACKSFPIDTSAMAAQSGDTTLVLSADSAIPKQGIDVLRVPESSEVHQKMTIVLPFVQNFVSGEVTLRYRDRVITRTLSAPVLQVEWRDIVDDLLWHKSYTGVVQITAQVQYTDGTSDAKFVDILGYSFIRVLAKGYAPLPVGSKEAAWSGTCKVQYSTSGRSSLECK